MFLACTTRLDIAHSVLELTKHNGHYSSIHWQAALRVLQYLYHSRRGGLHYTAQSEGKAGLRCFADSDFAKAHDGKSVTGWVITYGGTAIAWQSAIQGPTARTVYEAEYHALASAMQATRSIQLVLEDMHQSVSKIPWYSDNLPMVKMVNQGRIQSTKPVRHVRLNFGFIFDLLQRGCVLLSHVRGTQNPADMFTKSLTAPLRDRFCQLVGMSF